MGSSLAGNNNSQLNGASKPQGEQQDDEQLRIAVEQSRELAISLNVQHGAGGESIFALMGLNEAGEMQPSPEFSFNPVAQPFQLQVNTDPQRPKVVTTVPPMELPKKKAEKKSNEPKPAESGRQPSIMDFLVKPQVSTPAIKQESKEPEENEDGPSVKDVISENPYPAEEGEEDADEDEDEDEDPKNAKKDAKPSKEAEKEAKPAEEAKEEAKKDAEA